MSAPSTTQIRKAGRLLRDAYKDERLWLELSPEEQDAFAQAYEVVAWYRDSFATPLLKVRMGLQSFVKTCGYPDAKVAQRHKRFARMMLKLVREPSMQLTTMQDIGGCRVVLPDIEAVYALAKHIRKRWVPGIVAEYDYIDQPRDSGYRAIHIVVERDGRRIEVQLRTDRQHAWADTVEALSRRVGAELKWDAGPDVVLAGLRSLADAMAALDEGREIPADARRIIQQLLGEADTLGG